MLSPTDATLKVEGHNKGNSIPDSSVHAHVSTYMHFLNAIMYTSILKEGSESMYTVSASESEKVYTVTVKAIACTDKPRCIPQCTERMRLSLSTHGSLFMCRLYSRTSLQACPQGIYVCTYTNVAYMYIRTCIEFN